MIRPVTVSLQSLHKSSAFQFLEQHTPTSGASSNESNLLQAIRSVLRGSDTENLSTIQTTYHYDTQLDDRELTWNANTVILSHGGVIRRRWTFDQEGETIQWACLGVLEQVETQNPRDASASASTSTISSPQSGKSPSERPTFGPFTRAQAASQIASNHATLVPAIFIFLRSVGRIILQNGVEYSLSLPFIVRKAWPLFPHGVMIQRVLEPSEFLEAELTGEAVLPTIFSMTSPLAEAAAVGLTAGIAGGYRDIPVTLKDEDENSTRPLRSVPSTEMVVTVTRQGKDCTVYAVVTVDVEQRKLSIWRYAYLKPKDMPVPLTESRTRESKKRHSIPGPGSRRTSAIYDGAGRLHHPLSPGRRSPEVSPTPDIFDVPLPEMPPLSALPGMAPSLSTATTLQSLVSGGPSQRSAATAAKAGRLSLTRNDLSVTMDRMVLGGRADADIEIPIEHGRMKAAYWMQRVYSQEISEEE